MRGWASRVWDWLTGRGDAPPAPPPVEATLPPGMALEAEAADGTRFYMDVEAARREALMPRSFPGIIARSGLLDMRDDITSPFPHAATVDTSDSAVSRVQEDIDRLRRWAKLWREMPGFAEQQGIPRIVEVPRQPGQPTPAERWAKLSAKEQADAMGIEWTAGAEVVSHLQWVGGLDSVLAARHGVRPETIVKIREELSANPT